MEINTTKPISKVTYEDVIIELQGSGGGENYLQWKCDNMHTLQYEFAGYTGSGPIPSLSGLDTTNVTDMLRMFHSCSNLTSLDLSSFNTANVTNMGLMFSGCSSLTSLDLSSFNTANVTNMNSMFSGCSSLIYLDISNFDFSSIGFLGGSTPFNNIPTDCLIYVKDQTAYDWVTGKNTSLTNVQIKGA